MSISIYIAYLYNLNTMLYIYGLYLYNCFKDITAFPCVYIVNRTKRYGKDLVMQRTT